MSKQTPAVHILKRKNPTSNERSPSAIPLEVQEALRKALKLEGVPMSEYDDYLWLIAQESSGKVDVRNPHSTARGLFQLLRNHYALNPNGERSFGNAVEECQGGIRYVRGRYKTSSAARKFWVAHHWY